MSVLVTIAKIESDECAVTVGKVAPINLFWGVIQLMSITMSELVMLNGGLRGSVQIALLRLTDVRLGSNSCHSLR